MNCHKQSLHNNRYDIESVDDLSRSARFDTNQELHTCTRIHVFILLSLLLSFMSLMSLFFTLKMIKK